MENEIEFDEKIFIVVITFNPFGVAERVIAFNPGLHPGLLTLKPFGFFSVNKNRDANNGLTQYTSRVSKQK